MAVSDLITPVDPSGTFPTIPAGSDRVVFLTVNAGQSTAINATAPSAVTIGGVTATFVGGDSPSTSQLRATLSTWMLNEAQIALMSGSAISITGQTGSFTRGIAWGVQGASQLVTTRKNNGYVATGGITMSLARAADSWTFLAGYTQTAENITLTNPTRTSRILNVNIGYAAGTAQTVNSTTQSKTYVQTAHVLNIEPTPPYLVTSINGGAPITAGQVSVASITEGFTGLPTSITTNASGVTCSSIGGTTNAPTFTLSDRVDGGLYPKSGTSVNFTFVNGSESAVGAQTVVKKSTETTVIISSPLFTANTIANAILAATGRTVADSDEFYHTAYSDLVITPDTDFTVTDAGSFDLWLYVNSGADAGRNYHYAVTVNDAGEAVSVGLTTSGITTRGLTTMGLTHRGI